MCDVQKVLGVENIYDLLRKEIWGIYETDNPTKEQKRKCKRLKKDWIMILILILDIPIVILY